MALRQVWLMGDNFAATTYRKYFLLPEMVSTELNYIKTKYDLRFVTVNSIVQQKICL